MQVFKYLIVGAICLALLNPVDAGWFRRTARKIRDKARRIVKAVKKAACKVLFGVACPALVGAAGTAITIGTSSTVAALVAMGVSAGAAACHVRKMKCKREAPQEMEDMVMVPFSDEFRDYDMNEDNEIAYEEFVSAVMQSVPMADPEELREPFAWADMNGDDKLDTDEFMGAPFFFAHYDDDTAIAA